MSMRHCWLYALLVGLLLLIPTGSAAAPHQSTGEVNPVYFVQLQNPITSASVSYLRRALHYAEASQANALIIELHSGGGVVGEIQPFAAEVAQAHIPVVVYIAADSRSGAAGAFLLSAAQISAMAPNSSFGIPGPLATSNATTAQSQSMVQDSIADQLRDWNRPYGRNITWIDQAFQNGVVLTNEQAIALTPPAIDLVAADRDQLLMLLDGRTLTLFDKHSVKLATFGHQLEPIEPTLIERLWIFLVEPDIVFALLVLGALAICLELTAPGTSIFAGVGALMLIAALIGLLALPLNGWAIALIFLGLILIGLEFFVTSHGGLTITGLVFLTIGGLNLVDTSQAPGVSVAPLSIATVVSILAALIFIGFWLALQVRRKPAVTGVHILVGRVAEVRQRLDPQGMVFIDGALWQAVSENGAVEVGEWVRILEVHRLRLIVQRVE